MFELLYGFKYQMVRKILSGGWINFDSYMKEFPGSGRIDTAVWMHYLDANKTAGEEP